MQELLLNQVMTGKTRCTIGKNIYYVCAPSPAHKLEASHIYSETMYECSFFDILTDEEMVQFMIDGNLWSADEENELQSAPARLDALKVDMYQKYAQFQSTRVEKIRRLIVRLRKRQNTLAHQRHAYDLYTRSGLAHAFKLQYLISHNTINSNNEHVDLETKSDWVMRNILEEYTSNRPDDILLRKLSQNNKWRMMWASGKQEGSVFGVPSTYLTEEQQNLIAWSKMYDNIHEHPEPPNKDVMADDDMLDGWIILEQKKREKEQQERTGVQMNKPGSQEIYVPVETAEDAKRVDNMNDQSMQFVKRQRMAALKNRKVVGEENMPDSKQQISVQAAQQFRDRMRRK